MINFVFQVLPRWKLVMVGVAITICFLMIFPNISGPIFSLIFGKRDTQPTQQVHRPDHPSMGPGGERSRSPRPPMPGGRMGGFENQPSQTSSRGGMFSWLMPFYTVGVMGFLIYSLYKMKTKKKKNRRRRYRDEDDSDVSDSEDGKAYSSL